MRVRWNTIGWPLAATIVVGALLRLINIAAEPYWVDEVLSIDIVTHFPTYGEMFRYLREVEFHPPLYYAVLKSWVAAFGTSEAATRSLSLIFGIAVIPLTYALGNIAAARR